MALGEMTAGLGSSGIITAGRVRTGLQICLGLALFVHGVALQIGVVNRTLPPTVYLLAGIGMFVYGMWLTKQS